MAGKKYTEPVAIKAVTYSTDGAGGRAANGETLIDNPICDITIRPARFTNEGGVKQDLKSECIVSLWLNPNYELSESNFLEWRGKRLNIVSLTPSDDFLKVSILAKEA